MATRKSSNFKSITKPQPISSWSYSRYSDYLKCPKSFYFKHVMRMKEPPNDAMKRGTRIHQLAEDYLNGEIKRLPPELAKFAGEFKDLRKRKAKAELSLTFTKDWEKETTWDDWNNAWVRIKIDALVDDNPEVVELVDWKTGKVNDNHRGQLSLYGIGGLLRYPNAQKVLGNLSYLDQGEVVEEEYERKHLPILIKDWAKKTKAMLTDTRYKEKPGGACTYCIFAKSKGGPCKY